MTSTRRPGRDALILKGALAVAAVHALDDAFLHRGPGVGLGRHAPAALVALAACLAVAAAFSRLRPGLRSALAIGVGIPAVANGTMHILHVSSYGASAGDFTGVLAAAAGAVLIGLGASIPWRHRAERTSTRSRRWAARLVGVAGGLAAAVGLALPIVLGIMETHKQRSDVGRPPSSAYRAVSFRATDGVRLEGWFRPSRNGATVITIHGGGSDRNGAMRHAEMLADRGYGVLAYDARGRGESEGSGNSYGWGWEKDAAGALDYLESRPDVDPARIGALGLSSGADTALDLAAHRTELAATVSDGGALRTFEDTQRLSGASVMSGPGWVLFSTVATLTGSTPPEPLEELVARVESPLLLISAGTDDERDFNVSFARAGGPATEHWNLPGSTHTAPIRTHREAYEQRVVGFLDRALLGR